MNKQQMLQPDHHSVSKTKKKTAAETKEAMAMGGNEPACGTRRQLKRCGWEAAFQVVTVTTRSLGSWHEYFL